MKQIKKPIDVMAHAMKDYFKYSMGEVNLKMLNNF
jgi:hypothetical protein